MTQAAPKLTPEAQLAASPSPPRSFWKKLLLLVISALFCVLAFVLLDAGYSYLFRKSAVPTRQELVGCKIVDFTRVYSLRPDCSCVRAWGHERYVLAVDSQGFRDKTVRQVPLTGPRPRLLLLGDSFTMGMGPWETSFAGRLAARYPQYEILNGGVDGYSPSTYLETARLALTSGLDFDEVIVFVDISDVQDEAALVHDIDRSGAVAYATVDEHYATGYSHLRYFISKYLVLTNYLWELGERTLVGFGRYYLDRGFDGDIFNLERSAWTYREVAEDKPFQVGYAPLGVDGGIAKEKHKMDLLWEELARHHIPISVVVYPWPAQLVYDKLDSRQVQIWRDWCNGKCKRFLTAFPEFFALKQQCPSRQPGCWYLNNYIFGDIHFSAGGNAVMADLLSRSLDAEPPAKHPPAP
jgi:hypothetical protein